MKKINAALAAAALVAASVVTTVVTGTTPAAAHAVNPADFQQITLAKGVAEMGEPISLAVLPDRSALHTSRDGVLRRTDANGNTAVIGTLSVYSVHLPLLRAPTVHSGR
jgi:hypothetical protein